ncbi:sigma-70 family RNA polymerase sigma factor [Clostridium sp. DFI.5.61]|nr:sigma-70 family RNA polymerase sigma factor [Clostridium sp. DFI.5.61]
MENLYSSYHRLMYHTIHLITEDPWITEDILQSTTEKLIQNLDTIKHLPQPKLVNYIKTASTNTTYTYLRKRNLDAITPLSGLENEYELSQSSKENPELLFLRDEDINCFTTVFNELDEKDRYLLTSRFVEGKSYSSLSEDLGIQPDSVRMAVTRAKRKAAAILKRKYLTR